MKCAKVRETLDQLVFEPGFTPDEQLMDHIRNCPGCTAYLDEARESSWIMTALRQSEPVLADPEQLTLDILRETARLQGMIPVAAGFRSSSARIVDIMVRVLAAASVTLLLVLGMEQFAVVTKVTLLEKQSSEAAREPGYRVSPRTLPLADLSTAGLGKSYRIYEGSFASSFGLLKKRMETKNKP